LLDRLAPIPNSSPNIIADRRSILLVNDITFLRLSKGPRYCLALRVECEGILSGPFWSVEQGLLASGYALDDPPPFEIEVFSAMPHLPMPIGFSLFVRSSRKRIVQGVVVWAPEGILPSMFASVGDAQSAAFWASGKRRSRAGAV
jgi:hypothetical protein